MKFFLKRLIILISTTIAVLAVCLLALFIYFEPRRNGLNMAHWLQLLKSDKTLAGSPLQIIRIKEAEDSGVEFELPLTFDLMLTNDLIYNDGTYILYKNAVIYFWIDGRNFNASLQSRATNGNCLFWASKDQIYLGTNQIQAHMTLGRTIAGREYKDRLLCAEGPVFNYISTNLFLVNPNPVSIYTKRLLLRVKVLADQATYRIEIRDTNNQLIQTFSGKPDRDRVIDERWDAVTDSGKDYWGQSVKVIYEVTAPGFPPQTIEHTYQLKFP
jgi:hypothetical protein